MRFASGARYHAAKVGAYAGFTTPRVFNAWDYGAKADGVTNDAAAFQAAHDALPSSGGVITAPRGFTCQINSTITLSKPVILDLHGATIQGGSQSALFAVGANLTVRGGHRMKSVITAPSGGKIFNVTGSSDPGTNTGNPYIGIYDVTLLGNGATSMAFDTSAIGGTANFTGGGIFIERCNIRNCGGTAVYIATDITFTRIWHCTFVGNGQSVYAAENADTWILENEFNMPQGVTLPGVNALGPNVHVVGNVFEQTRSGSTGGVIYQDLRVEPLVSTATGGWVWVERNRFGGEGEGLNCQRSRLQVYSPTNPTGIGLPMWILNNVFQGVDASLSGTAVRDGTSHVVTVTSANHSLQTGDTLNAISSVDNTLNGVYSITVVDANTFTYTQSSGAAISSPEAVTFYAARDVAIDLRNPCVRLVIDGNFFQNYGVLVNDRQTNGNGLRGGLCVWGPKNTTQHTLPKGGWLTFANGGVNFAAIDTPLGSELADAPRNIPQREQVQLQNLLTHSEDFSNADWVQVGGGITVTTGQTDRYGTKRACLLSRDGSAASQYIYEQKGGFTAGQRAEFSVDLKDSTAGKVLLAVEDVVSGSQWLESMEVSLSSTWKRHTLSFVPVRSGNHRFCVFIGDWQTAAPGAVYAMGAQVSSTPSDYVPTVTTAISGDTEAGSRFERAIVFSALKADAARVNSDGTSNQPTVSCSGFGTGATAVLDALSTDTEGLITITVGTTPSSNGSLTLTFNKAKAVAPRCQPLLEDGNGGANSWGSSSARVNNASATRVIFSITNVSSLTNGNQYLFRYLNIERMGTP